MSDTVKNISEEEAPVEKTPEKAPEDTEPDKPQQDSTQLKDLKIAYVVGMDQNDNWVFDIFGQEANLVNLLGVHYHAVKVINRLYDDKRGWGDALTNQVGLFLQQMDAKLTGLFNKTKSDNDL